MKDRIKFLEKPCFPSELGGIVVTNLKIVPKFSTYKNQIILKKALDREQGGKVVTGGPCGGVCLQRVWYLLHGKLESEVWKQVGQWSVAVFGEGNGAVVATYMVEWFRKENFHSDHVDSWTDVAGHLREGHIILTVLNYQHWVTVVGIGRTFVYVIDYGGLYKVKEEEFARNVRGVPVFAAGAIIWVGK
jgi:hypothetical protein